MNLCTFAQVAQRIAKLTRIGSYFAVVACLTVIAKLFLSDGDALEKLIVEFLQYKFHFIHTETV